MDNTNLADSKNQNACHAKKQIWAVLRSIDVVDKHCKSDDIILTDESTYNVMHLLKPEFRTNEGLENLCKLLSAHKFSETWATHTLGKAPDGSQLQLDPETKEIIFKDPPSITNEIAQLLQNTNTKIIIGQCSKLIYENGQFLAQTYGKIAGINVQMEQLLGTLKPQIKPEILLPSLLDLQETMTTHEDQNKFGVVLTNFNIPALIDFIIAQFTLYQIKTLASEAPFRDTSPNIQCNFITSLLQLTGQFSKIIQGELNTLPSNIARLVDFSNLVNPIPREIANIMKPEITPDNDVTVQTLQINKKNSQRRKRGVVRKQTIAKSSENTTHIYLQTNIANAHKEFLSQLVLDCESQIGPLIAISHKQFNNAQQAQQYGKELLLQVWGSKSTNMEHFLKIVPLGQFCDLAQVGSIIPDRTDLDKINNRVKIREIDQICIQLLRLYKSIVPQHNVCSTLFTILAHIKELANIGIAQPSLFKLARNLGMLSSSTVYQLVTDSITLVYRYFQFNSELKKQFDVLISILDIKINNDNTQSPSPEFQDILKKMEHPDNLKLIYKELYDLFHAAKTYFGEPIDTANVLLPSKEHINFVPALLQEYHSKIASLLTSTTDNHALNYFISCLFPETTSNLRIMKTQYLINNVLSPNESKEFIQLINKFLIAYRRIHSDTLLKMWTEVEEVCQDATNQATMSLSKEINTMETETPNKLRLHAQNLSLNAGALQLMRLLGFGINHTTMMINNYWLDGAYHEFSNTGTILYNVAKKVVSSTMTQCPKNITNVVADVTRALFFNMNNVLKNMNPSLIEPESKDTQLMHAFVDFVLISLSDVVLSTADTIYNTLIGCEIEPCQNFKSKTSHTILEVFTILGLLEDEVRDGFLNALHKTAANYIHSITPEIYEKHLKQSNTLLSKLLSGLNGSNIGSSESTINNTAEHTSQIIGVNTAIERARHQLDIASLAEECNENN